MLKILLMFISTIIVYSEISLSSNFKSNFKQTIVNKNDKVIKYEGIVKYLKKDIFKWEYKIPIKREVCLSNNEMMIIDHDLEQIDFYKIKDRVSLEYILSNAIKIYKNKNIYKTTFEDITYFIFTTNSKKINRIEYVDNFDNKVTIKFTKTQYNINFSKIDMKCYLPANYDR